MSMRSHKNGAQSKQLTVAELVGFKLLGGEARHQAWEGEHNDLDAEARGGMREDKP